MTADGLTLALEAYQQAQDELVEARNRLARAIAGAAMSGATRDEIVDLTGYTADLVLRICRDAGISESSWVSTPETYVRLRTPTADPVLRNRLRKAGSRASVLISDGPVNDILMPEDPAYQRYERLVDALGTGPVHTAFENAAVARIVAWATEEDCAALTRLVRQG
jgi:hypothetical protein